MTPKILASSIGFHEFLFCPTEISVMKSKYSYLEQFYKNHPENVRSIKTKSGKLS